MTLDTLPRVNGFPGHEQEVRQLVGEHLKLEDEPLLAAVYYAPTRMPGDVFLFEIIEGFGQGHVDPERHLFEVAYGSTGAFHLNAGEHLRLVLTHPDEFRIAAREQWELVRELRAAFQDGRAIVLYETPRGRELLDLVAG